MNILKFKLSALLILGLCFSGVQAQEALPATGGNASGSGGSVSYTVGQIFYNSNTGTNGNIQQGIQQPYEIFVISGLENTGGISLGCKIFPNPTADKLMLKIENYDWAKLSFQLFNPNGKLLIDRGLTENETTISMENLKPGIHLNLLERLNNNLISGNDGFGILSFKPILD